MRKQTIIVGVLVAVIVCFVMAEPNATQTKDIETPGQVEKIVATPGATLNQKLAFLATNIDIHDGEIRDLKNRLAALETRGTGEAARYQIAATTIRIEGGVYPQDFVQVFKMDTRTGSVCQVVGPKVVKGELYGTTLPYCTQQ
jgi:hypothetical protein